VLVSALDLIQLNLLGGSFNFGKFGDQPLKIRPTMNLTTYKQQLETQIEYLSICFLHPQMKPEPSNIEIKTSNNNSLNPWLNM
jgi:hypothetical protein